MIEAQLDMAATAAAPKREHIIHELARYPDEVLPAVVDVMSHQPSRRWEVAVQVIRTIGYPRNASAIPALLGHLGDPNWPGWHEAVAALVDIGPAVIVPHLIQRLWDRGQTNPHWAHDVEGICAMLCQVDEAYAEQCGPLIAHLLGHPSDRVGIDASWLLDALQRAGTRSGAYALPVLIDLDGDDLAPGVRAQLQRFIQSFDQEALNRYDLIRQHNNRRI